MNKKSMFFSISSILIIGIFIINFEMSQEKLLEENKIKSTQSRVKSLNSFINDMENVYFERMLYTSAKNSLDVLSKYAADHTVSLEVSRNDFNTVFQFGYIEPPVGGGRSGANTICNDFGKILENCRQYESRSYEKIDLLLGKNMMQNYSFFELINRTEFMLESLGVRTKSFKISVLPLRQVSPWIVRLKATILYHFEDIHGTASWKGETTKEIDVDIYGITDPKTGKEIKEDWHFDRGLNDICGLAGTLESRCAYTEPSFLSRLQGNDFSSIDKEYGICPPEDNCYNT